MALIPSTSSLVDRKERPQPPPFSPEIRAAVERRLPKSIRTYCPHDEDESAAEVMDRAIERTSPILCEVVLRSTVRRLTEFWRDSGILKFAGSSAKVSNSRTGQKCRDRVRSCGRKLSPLSRRRLIWTRFSRSSGTGSTSAHDAVWRSRRVERDRNSDGTTAEGIRKSCQRYLGRLRDQIGDSGRFLVNSAKGTL